MRRGMKRKQKTDCYLGGYASRRPVVMSPFFSHSPSISLSMWHTGTTMHDKMSTALSNPVVGPAGLSFPLIAQDYFRGGFKKKKRAKGPLVRVPAAYV